MTERPAPLDQAADQLRLLRRQLAPGQQVMLEVRSGSMVPLMPVGARIAVEPVRGEDCQPGDIAVFPRQGRLIAHRVLLRIGAGPGSWFLERGDGVSPPGVVRAAQVVGRVVAVQGPAGAREDLATDAARWQARRTVRRSLVRAGREAARHAIRRLLRWPDRRSSDSDSARP